MQPHQFDVLGTCSHFVKLDVIKLSLFMSSSFCILSGPENVKRIFSLSNANQVCIIYNCVLSRVCIILIWIKARQLSAHLLVQYSSTQEVKWLSCKTNH